MTVSRERPIIFSGPMVNAILEGHKTQTRRVVRDQGTLTFLACEDSRDDGGDLQVAYMADHPRGPGYYAYCGEYPEEGTEHLGAPFGRPGDRLWVREVAAWNPAFREPEEIWYRADPKWDEPGSGYYPDNKNWRSPIHMPRWASRITLEILSVRVERLQAITEADIRAEGFGWEYDDWRDEISNIAAPPGSTYQTLTEFFAGRWDNLNHKRGHGWDTNPWVWAIDFKQVTP